MTYRFPFGAFVMMREPDAQGRRSDGSPMVCRVLAHVSYLEAKAWLDRNHAERPDLSPEQPMYLVNEGIIHHERYQMLVSEEELIPYHEPAQTKYLV